MTTPAAPHPPTVWPAFQAHDARAVITFLVALGFEETACCADDDGVVQHAQLDWPEAGGVVLGSHEPALRDPEGNQWSFGSYPGEPRRS